MLTRARRIARRWLPLAVGLYLLMLAMGLLLTHVFERVWPLSAEDEVNRDVAGARTPLLNSITHVVSWTANTGSIVVAAILLALLLRLLLHRWLESVFLLVAVATQSAVFLLTTLVVDRPRPQVHQLDAAPPTSSFPSGHTGASTALYVAAALVVAWHLRRRLLRGLLIAALLAVPIGVASARLYRGMHHPSDLAGSLVNGCLSVAIAGRAVLPERPGRRPDRRDRPSVPRAAVIVNPTKVSDLPTRRSSLTAAMRAHGWAEPLWCETTVDDPGRGLAADAARDGVDLVFAWGGDGTVMSVVTGLAGTGTPLALLPAGTGNLLARNLDLPTDHDTALTAGLTGTNRPIDVGRLSDGSCFVVMAGLGFDAAMMADAPEQLKARLGWPAYIVSGARHLRGHSMRVGISLDGGTPLHRRARMVLVGNVGRLQGGIPLLPDAEPDDGVLDVVLLAPRHLWGWGQVAAQVLLRRRTRGDRLVERFRCRRISIRTDRAEPRQLDGDPIGPGTALDIRVDPGALLLRMSAPSGQDAP